MDRLEQFYAGVGADAKDVIARLGGMPKLVERFLGKFQADESFKRLCAALDDGETQVAFREAHTMKGLCANLGIQSLFEQASAVTELLRAGDLTAAKTALPALDREYNRVLDLLNQCGLEKK